MRQDTSSMSTKLFIVTILVAVGGCWGSSLSLDGGGWHSDGLTLGEISLENHGYQLPTITLDHVSTGHGDGWKWPGSLISGSGWSHSSLGHGGWESGLSIDHGWNGKIIPVVKNIDECVGVPVARQVEIKIPHLVAKGVPQPYPILIPVTKPVPYEVVKTVIKRVEKKVPIPVDKVIPVKVEKPVPFTIYKSQPYPVVKHVPIKIPIYKTIHHYSHGHRH